MLEMGFLFQPFFLQIPILFRWKTEHSGIISLNRDLWNYPLNIWGTAFADFRSGRTNSYNVHLLVQFQQRPAGVRSRALFSLGWMVSELVFHITIVFSPCLGGILDYYYFLRMMSVIGFAFGRDSS